MTLATYTTYTPEVQAAIRIAQAIAKEYHHAQYTPAHLLKACLHKEAGLAAGLQSMNLDIYYLEEWADVRLDSLPRSPRLPDEPGPDQQAATVLQEADAIHLELNQDATDAWCLLIAISTPGVGFSYEQLKTFPFTREQLLGRYNKGKVKQATANGQHNSSSITPFNLKYIYRLTDPQRLEEQHALIGRDAEIRMMTEILTRKGRSSILVIGEGGVGKTSLASGLARAIVQKQVPL
ncbi:MAG TPA: AAA family ATPase, partial [Niastella sp.]